MTGIKNPALSALEETKERSQGKRDYDFAQLTWLDLLTLLLVRVERRRAHEGDQQR